MQFPEVKIPVVEQIVQEGRINIVLLRVDKIPLREKENELSDIVSIVTKRKTWQSQLHPISAVVYPDYAVLRNIYSGAQKRQAIWKIQIQKSKIPIDMRKGDAVLIEIRPKGTNVCGYLVGEVLEIATSEFKVLIELQQGRNMYYREMWVECPHMSKEEE